MESEAAYAQAHPRPQPSREKRRRSRMNNRDRARLYRLQNKQHAHELTTTVDSLREEVYRLQLVSEITRSLARCGITRQVRDRILVPIKPFFANPTRQIVIPAFDVRHAQLERASSFGSYEAPIVQVASVLTGQHPTTALEDIYRFIPGNSVLMDKLIHGSIMYPCVVRFYFSSEGELATTCVEVDWISGLLGCVGSLGDVSMVAEPLCELGDPYIVLWGTHETLEPSS